MTNHPDQMSAPQIAAVDKANGTQFGQYNQALAKFVAANQLGADTSPEAVATQNKRVFDEMARLSGSYKLGAYAPNMLKIAYNAGVTAAAQEAGLSKTAFEARHLLPAIGGLAGVYAGNQVEDHPIMGKLIGGIAGASLGHGLGGLGADRLARYVSEAAQAETGALRNAVRNTEPEKVLRTLTEEHAANQGHLFGVSDSLRAANPLAAQRVAERASSLGPGGDAFDKDLLDRISKLTSRGATLERGVADALPDRLANAERLRVALMGAGLAGAGAGASSIYEE